MWFGVTYPLGRYHDAEVQRIDALEKLQQAENAINRLGERLSSEITLLNNTVAKGVTPQQAQSFEDHIREAQPEMQKLTGEAQEATVSATPPDSTPKTRRTSRGTSFGYPALARDASNAMG